MAKTSWSPSKFIRLSGMGPCDARRLIKSPDFYPARHVGGRIVIDANRLHEWLQGA